MISRKNVGCGTFNARGRRVIGSLAVLLGLLLSACGGAAVPAQSDTAPADAATAPADAATAPTSAATAGRKSIVVTYSVLGAVVKELVGDAADVTVSMPNGQDPHEWEPSAKDIETLMNADMIVQNGLGLEGGMQDALAQAKDAGVKMFTAADHIEIRTVGEGEGLPTGDPDQAVGAEDPHLWMDPLGMKQVVAALAMQINADLGLDLSTQATSLEAQLDQLNTSVMEKVNTIPAANRKLVTGHESLGYYARRYSFKLVGAIVPSLTSQAEVSAADLASIKELIARNNVSAIFTELGTPPAVATTIAQESGVKVVELTTHALPDDGSYMTFMQNLTDKIVGALA